MYDGEFSRGSSDGGGLVVNFIRRLLLDTAFNSGKFFFLMSCFEGGFRGCMV